VGSHYADHKQQDFPSELTPDTYILNMLLKNKEFGDILAVWSFVARVLNTFKLKIDVTFTIYISQFSIHL